METNAEEDQDEAVRKAEILFVDDNCLLADESVFVGKVQDEDVDDFM